MSKTVEHFIKPVSGDCSAEPATVVLAVQKEVAQEVEKILKAGQKQGAYAMIRRS